MFIFILFLLVEWTLTPVLCGCVPKDDGREYKRCLSNWKLIKQTNKIPSTFLTDPSLLDKICDTNSGNSISDMDHCIKNNVHPYCRNMYVFWDDYKVQLNLLCRYKERFIGFKDCREDSRFTHAFDTCTSQFKANSKRKLNTCLLYETLVDCYSRSVTSYCSKESSHFFKLVFHAGVQNKMKYYKCTGYTVDKAFKDDTAANYASYIANEPLYSNITNSNKLSHAVGICVILVNLLLRSW